MNTSGSTRVARKAPRKKVPYDGKPTLHAPGCESIARTEESKPFKVPAITLNLFDRRDVWYCQNCFNAQVDCSSLPHPVGAGLGAEVRYHFVRLGTEERVARPLNSEEPHCRQGEHARRDAQLAISSATDLERSAPGPG